MYNTYMDGLNLIIFPREVALQFDFQTLIRIATITKTSSLWGTILETVKSKKTLFRS